MQAWGPKVVLPLCHNIYKDLIFLKSKVGAFIQHDQTLWLYSARSKIEDRSNNFERLGLYTFGEKLKKTEKNEWLWINGVLTSLVECGEFCISRQETLDFWELGEATWRTQIILKNGPVVVPSKLDTKKLGSLPKKTWPWAL